MGNQPPMPIAFEQPSALGRTLRFSSFLPALYGGIR